MAQTSLVKLSFLCMLEAFTETFLDYMVMKFGACVRRAELDEVLAKQEGKATESFQQREVRRSELGISLKLKSKGCSLS